MGEGMQAAGEELHDQKARIEGVTTTEIKLPSVSLTLPYM
jgi:hypothetical protein